MNKNILLCGVGGQGTVLASKILAEAAMGRGESVMSAETIGMAQKGGSVFSFLRVGEALCGPMLAKHSADIIIAFEPSEAVRMLPYLKQGGAVVVNSRPIMPVTAVLGGSDYTGAEMVAYLRRNVANLTVIDCERACREIGSPRVTNMVLLGAALRSGALDFSFEDLVTAMKSRVRPQFHEMNCLALKYNTNEKEAK
jgi:indolepyruvate ferredoxin oxidoreductase beta subunit